MNSTRIRHLFSFICSRGGWGVVGAATIGFAGVYSVSGGEVVNGDFTAGLTGWVTQGSVFGSSGIAVLTDGGTTRSLLDQPIGSAIGMFSLTFDYRDALSSTVPNGALADTLFASIYLSDNLAGLDVSGGGFAEAIPLFDLDSTGAFNVNGTLGPSSKGVDWVKFTLTFNSTHEFLAPVFDLRDLNTINNDSAAAFDNVVLRAVPEPSAAVVALIGIFGVVLCPTRKRCLTGPTRNSR